MDEVSRREIRKVKPDGHCLVHAWMECSKEFGDEIANETLCEFHVLLKLEVELRKNLDHYSNYVPGTVDILKQFQLYKDTKVYDTSTGDIILPALCSCFNTEVVIAERDIADNLHVKFHIPTTTKIERTYYLLRTGLHYDALISPGKCKV